MNTTSDLDTVRADTANVDVLILGGGLAGLTLALQLRANDPDLSIRVLERRQSPAPEAAFKIGESTVEIGGHYFSQVLGLRQHLDQRQIIKFGFRFFFSDGREDFDRCLELGASHALPTHSWQIDRGRFENFLSERVQEQGIDLRMGARVQRIELSEDEQLHQIEWEQDGQRQQASARWVVDASGRAGLIKRKLGLAEENGHHVNAVWFRIKGRIDPHDWSDNAEWLSRSTPPERWRSTSHLVGSGYWAWLIPLASGSHSIGIVCDAQTHPIEGMKTFDLTMQWLQKHQPRLWQDLDSRRDELQDFAFSRNFSYGCKQLFSPQRWALTGIAGAFLDPFYSPGSDFIAISNTYITQLIAKDRAGEQWQPYAAVYEQLFFSFYQSTLAIYRDQYHLFGDPQVLPLKILWDYTYYWGVLAALFFADRIADLTTLSRLRPELAEARALNDAVQAMLGDWGRRNAGDHADKQSAGVNLANGNNVFLDQAEIAWFANLNAALKAKLDDSAFRQRLRDNVQRLRDLARLLRQRAVAAHADIDTSAVGSVLGEIVVSGADSDSSSLLPPHWLLSA